MAARKLTEDRLVVASHNQGKVREIADLVKGLNVEVVSAGELGLPEPAETGSTFAENAALKARAAASGSGSPALADDSGLAVDALGGAPGIYAARWAGEPRDFMVAMEKVWHKLEDAGTPEDERTAHFVCALALAWPDGHCEIFEGRVDGRIVWPPRGDKGFGYDPIFLPDGRDVTFAEMDPDEKHRISHRARAFEKLARVCFG